MPAKGKNNNTAANLGFEGKLWLAADKLRKYTDGDLRRAEVFQLAA
jgi:hypothetical protein